MDFIQLVALAVLQGFTEFLPISSSGHLILLPVVMGWADQGLAFDIAAHLGTLVAVVVFFRCELLAMTKSLFVFENPQAQLAWRVIVATIPFGLIGMLVADRVQILRTPTVIATTSIVFGIFLWATDRLRRGTRAEDSLTWLEAVLIGASQALALVPGTSRAGITMTVALACGMSREAAGRFAFLLAIPAICLAAIWQFLRFSQSPEAVLWGPLAITAFLSGLVAFATIAVFLRIINRIGMGIFAAYRIALAVFIVAVT